MRTVIVQLSDLHLPAEGRLFGQIDAEARLARALEQIVGWGQDVAALIVTGDVADHGEDASYARAAPLLRGAAERLGAELICVPGNHDDVGAFARHLHDHDRNGDGTAATGSVTWIGELRVIGLDSTAPDGHHGELTCAQLEWLAGELRRPARDGTILALHHPPVLSPLAVLAELQLRDPDRLAAAILDSDIRLIVCGHDHHTGSAVFAGIPVWIAPSVTYTIDALGQAGRIQGTAHGAITLIEVHDDTVVTTQVPVLDGAQGYVIDLEVGPMLAAYSPGLS